jgi:phosphoglycolate phosphatase-like HAD superfamily hydrolase
MKNIARVAPFLACWLAVGLAHAQDPLPSWNDGPSRRAIAEFVAKVTAEESLDFVKPAERIAVFDNDGTLWCEQPAYVQALFVVDRIRALAKEHPEWKETEPYKSVLSGDMKELALSGEEGIVQLVAATHTGMTTAEFHALVRDWIKTARHPKFERPYTECIYQPMLELLAYLRARGFKTFIVSGGDVEFMRPWTEVTYGIPPEQVVGSSTVVKFEMRDGQPVLVKEPEIEFIDNGAGKPVGINRLIGRRPILAFGNSDRDLEMLQYTTIARGPRLGLIVHHTDAEREYAYDRRSNFGRLDKALDEAPRRGWIVVDMKTEWKTVFPEMELKED